MIVSRSTKIEVFYFCHKTKLKDLFFFHSITHLYPSQTYSILQKHLLTPFKTVRKFILTIRQCVFEQKNLCQMHNDATLKNKVSTYFDRLATDFSKNILSNSEDLCNQNYFESINEKLQPLHDISGVLKETLEAPLLRTFFVDTFSVFSEYLIKNQPLNKKAALQVIVFLANFLTRETLIYYGDFFDIICGIFERCTIEESVQLCECICDQHKYIKEILDQEPSATLRIARARLVALVNAFEKKIYGTIDNFSGILSRLKTVCFKLIPMNFQGLCNKGIRDAYGRHFNLKERNFINDLGQRFRKFDCSEIVKGHEEVADTSMSDTSAEVEKGSHQKKRRRLSSVRSDSLDVDALFRSVHGNWESILNFFQDPALLLGLSNLSEGKEYFNLLKKLLILLSHHNSIPSISEVIPRAEGPLPFIKHQHLCDRVVLCCGQAYLDKAHTPMDYTTNGVYGLNYFDNLSLDAFKEAWTSSAFKRSILMALISTVRVFYINRHYVNQKIKLTTAQATPSEGLTALCTILSPSLVSSLSELHKNLCSLLHRCSSCFNGVPSVSIHSLPWFSAPRNWYPPLILSDFVNELNDQETLMTHWKKTGYTETWKNDLETVPKDLLNHPIALSSRLRVGTIPNQSTRFKYKQRPNSYITEFLPVLSFLDTALDESVVQETSTQIKVIGHDNLPPPAFYREREEWCLPESTLSKTTLLRKTIPEKLVEKWNDYKEKVMSDEDAINQIEPADKVVNDSVFQWRCDRLLNFTNLQLYDYSNQNRELRSKIREASLEDIIRAAMQLETKTGHAVATKIF
ncbi:uncharacterized protein LOC128884421 isoform X2 [Hylaeus volcanicus]|uniref:uncharacterized protein LOC128884421 isoform X2 n=1 Tax=Hylaeus volcanicus TaxID=313075 RepID=UPI0023B7D23C|nr:uncharacterized protein LOC128884421 isoform X2 [Hylaeus volcanicus]